MGFSMRRTKQEINEPFPCAYPLQRYVFKLNFIKNRAQEFQKLQKAIYLHSYILSFLAIVQAMDMEGEHSFSRSLISRVITIE